MLWLHIQFQFVNAYTKAHCVPECSSASASSVGRRRATFACQDLVMIIYMYFYIYMHMYIYVCTYIYICIYIYIQFGSSWLRLFTQALFLLEFVPTLCAMAGVPEQQPVWVESLMNGIVNRVQEENRKMIADLQTKTDKHDEDITALKKKVFEHDEAIAKITQNGQKATSADSDRMYHASGRPSVFKPGYVAIRGFCEFNRVRTEGVTRAEAETLHKELSSALPESLRSKVSDYIRLKGNRDTSCEVDVDPSCAVEVAGLWSDMLAMSENAKNNGRLLKAKPETRPEVQDRNVLFGRLKSIAHHEFGEEAVTDSWYPSYQIDVAVPGEVPMKFAHLSAYGSKVMWGPAATTTLGWTEEIANEKLATFRR